MEYMKKAVSYFMPYKRVAWCEGRGNPTRSSAVNDLLHHVKQLEARNEGAPSPAKCPLMEAEFLLKMKLMRQQGKEKRDWAHFIKYPTMSIWQFNFIGRVDDTGHHKVTDPKGHKRFPFVLQCKVRWSKNVVDKRKCPDQIALGADDPNWCLQLLLSIYMESYLQQFPHAKYLFTEHINIDPETKKDKAPNNLKEVWRKRLRKVVWDRPEFADIEVEDEDEEGGIGTHSRRKFAADYAANCGMSDYEIEIRARWKQLRSGKIVHIYIGVKRPSRMQKYVDVFALEGQSNIN